MRIESMHDTVTTRELGVHLYREESGAKKLLEGVKMQD